MALITGVSLLSLSMVGCVAGQKTYSGMVETRFGTKPLQNFDVADKRAKYDPETHTFTTATKRFKVYFPIAPGAIPGQYQIRGADGQISEFFSAPGWYRLICPGEELDYSVQVIPDAGVCGNTFEDIRARTNRCLTNTIQELGFTESSRKAIAFPNTTTYGLEAEGKLPNRVGMFRIQIFSDKADFAYKLLVAGSPEQVKGPEADRFFDSFIISKY